MARERAEREIQNLKRAYDGLLGIGVMNSLGYPGALRLTEDQIREVHQITTDGIEHPENVPGQYRHHKVVVGDAGHGGIYTPPKIYEDIAALMKEYVPWINGPDVMDLHPFIRAALAHYHLALIHPFADGNGRVARLVEALVLRFSGIDYVPMALSNYYYGHVDDYFWAFSLAEKDKEHRVTPFVEFVMRAVVESLKEIKDSIVIFIRRLTLRDFYHHMSVEGKLKRRQLDLLNILLDSPATFSLGDLFHQPKLEILYRGVSERTARRDMKALCDRRFLICSKDGYDLNLRVIG